MVTSSATLHRQITSDASTTSFVGRAEPRWDDLHHLDATTARSRCLQAGGTGRSRRFEPVSGRAELMGRYEAARAPVRRSSAASSRDAQQRTTSMANCDHRHRPQLRNVDAPDDLDRHRTELADRAA
jgi:hypothetical protein